MVFDYLIKYQTFPTVKEMDEAVNKHIYYNGDELPKSNREILKVFAQHSLIVPGVSRVKIATIAKETGYSETTVHRAIKRLKELHVIKVEQGTKLNGIQGANIYCIQKFSHEVTELKHPRKTIEREEVETPCGSKVEEAKIENQSITSFNPFVTKTVVNNVNACVMQQDLKSSLRDAYNPQSVEGNKAFNELCKIAFGRIKQYMRTHNMPYLQMEQIVLKAMNDLVRKQGVRNQFAMYSKMIERQTLRLFEKFIQPVQAVNKPSREMVPKWFDKRNEPSTVVDNGVDYEVERQKILAKIGG